MVQTMKWLALCAFVLVTVGCEATSEQKQGGEGDFCNARDTDCRNGFVCVTGVCRALTSSGSYSCDEICTRLDECQTGEENCVADCRATFEGSCSGTPCPWSSSAQDAFGECIVDDLTCEQARQDDAVQQCYQSLELSTERRARCDAFAATGSSDRCNTTEEQGDALTSACYLLARTATDASWARTDACVDRVTDGVCDEIHACFNSVFGLTLDRNNFGGPGIDPEPF